MVRPPWLVGSLPTVNLRQVRSHHGTTSRRDQLKESISLEPVCGESVDVLRRFFSLEWSTAVRADSNPVRPAPLNLWTKIDVTLAFHVSESDHVCWPVLQLLATHRLHRGGFTLEDHAAVRSRTAICMSSGIPANMTRHIYPIHKSHRRNIPRIEQ
jgi:hypothetical protein